MGNDQEFDKVVEKIKKCLALASSSNENEAQRAAQKAQELLIKHNLTMQQVESYEAEYIEQTVDKKIFPKCYEKFINSVLIKYFFVKVLNMRVLNKERFLHSNDKPSWYDRYTILLGTKTNVQIASYVRSFLCQKFYGLWLDYKRKTSVPARYEQSYYNGLHDGLCRKLERQKSSIEEEMGLILVADPKLNEMVKHYSTKKVSGWEDYYSAMEAGIEDGKNIEIQRGIDNKTIQSNKYIEG